jgi:hypothetical protein
MIQPIPNNPNNPILAPAKGSYVGQVPIFVNPETNPNPLLTEFFTNSNPLLTEFFTNSNPIIENLAYSPSRSYSDAIWKEEASATRVYNIEKYIGVNKQTTKLLEDINISREKSGLEKISDFSQLLQLPEYSDQVNKLLQETGLTPDQLIKASQLDQYQAMRKINQEIVIQGWEQSRQQTKTAQITAMLKGFEGDNPLASSGSASA